MKISRKATYGLRALSALARHPEGRSAHTLASEECLPEDYLEKILQHLKRSGFVISEQGVHGGYTLRNAPETISIWSILEDLDGGFREIPAPSFEGSIAPCPILSHCETKGVWQQLEGIVRNTLSKVTLKDLISERTLEKN